MYDYELTATDDYLATAQTVPADASELGNGGSIRAGHMQGAIEVVAVVNAEIDIADTKTFTISLQESSDDAATDAYAALATIYSLTSSGGDTLTVGTELARYAIPSNAEAYIRAVITTDDTAATGKVDIFLVYKPR